MTEETSWHSLAGAEALQALGSGIDGLSAVEARERLQRFGPNVIPEPSPKKLIMVYLDQFKNAFIYLLLIAAVVSILVSEYGDAVFIAVALQINALIGTIQEWQAQKRVLGLRNLVKSRIAVLRDSNWEEIDGHQLVPGDIVEIEAGTRVPALLRLLSSEALEADESLLSGESMPVVKDADAIFDAHTSLADRNNLLHAGSTILRGHATAVVSETGSRTEVGRVAESLKSAAKVAPPLIVRMKKFTHIVAGLMVIVIAAIAGGEFYRGTEPIVILMTSVALAVAAIPEGLPVALTVALSISVSRMAKRDVVVRKMAAVEGLGACTMIAADKTGTLTINELSAQRVCLPGEQDRAIETLCPQDNPGDINAPFNRLVTCGLLCNEARLMEQADGSSKLFGDTVDGAFLKLALRAGIDREQADATNPRQGRIPYEPALAFAASFHSGQDGMLHAWVKGAAEVVLPFCATDDKEAILREVDKLAGEGYRVIALAEGAVSDCGRQHLQGLTFLGLVAPNSAGLSSGRRGRANDHGRSSVDRSGNRQATGYGRASGGRGHRQSPG
jgi:magnesium-transporting ATPase (P-type)